MTWRLAQPKRSGEERVHSAFVREQVVERDELPITNDHALQALSLMGCRRQAPTHLRVVGHMSKRRSASRVVRLIRRSRGRQRARLFLAPKPVCRRWRSRPRLLREVLVCMLRTLREGVRRAGLPIGEAT